MRFSKISFHLCCNVFERQIQFLINSSAIIVCSKSSNIRYVSRNKKTKTSNQDLKIILDKIEKYFYKTESRQIKITKTKIISLTCLVCCLVYILGSAETDQHGFYIKDELSEKPLILQYLTRSIREIKYYGKLIKAPSKEKLLPDPLPHPYVQPKYTLVLELTDVLVHSEWTYSTGWRYKKRPFSGYFLETLQNDYEIVIYTGEQGIVAFPLLDAIDTKKVIAHKLVREATYFSTGAFIKALDKLNRDLSKVICVDCNPKNVKNHPENLLNVKRWCGNDNDTSLVDLASFLKTIAANNIEDVREVLKHYSKFDDPVEAYRKKQRRLIEELDEQATAEKV